MHRHQRFQTDVQRRPSPRKGSFGFIQAAAAVEAAANVLKRCLKLLILFLIKNSGCGQFQFDCQCDLFSHWEYIKTSMET